MSNTVPSSCPKCGAGPEAFASGPSWWLCLECAHAWGKAGDGPSCQGRPPLKGCDCGLGAGPGTVPLAAVRHAAKLAAGTSSPGLTILGMARGLDELASRLSWRTDETWCRELAENLRGFARQLPTQDGGEDAAREVRHG